MSAAKATPEKVALAAAHGITPRFVASFSPHVAQVPRVLVPVHLDALVIRRAHGT